MEPVIESRDVMLADNSVEPFLKPVALGQYWVGFQKVLQVLFLNAAQLLAGAQEQPVQGRTTGSRRSVGGTPEVDRFTDMTLGAGVALLDQFVIQLPGAVAPLDPALAQVREMRPYL